MWEEGGSGEIYEMEMTLRNLHRKLMSFPTTVLLSTASSVPL